MDPFETAVNVVSTEELRAAAMASAYRRGKFVAARRVALRWSSWLIWQWLLPLIGLATVLAALVAVACVQIFGPSTVIDSTQTWLSEQWGMPKLVQTYKKNDTSEALPRFDNGTMSGQTGGPQLQIDRGLASQDLKIIQQPSQNNQELNRESNR